MTYMEVPSGRRGEPPRKVPIEVRWGLDDETFIEVMAEFLWKFRHLAKPRQETDKKEERGGSVSTL
jgi:hypothetical protein